MHTKEPERRLVRGGLIVSCQAYPGDPINTTDTLTRIAQTVVGAGVSGIRAQGPDSIRSFRTALGSVPIIGLWKIGETGVRITPTLESAIAVAEAGADIVALDATRRPRPDGLSFRETAERLKSTADVAVMADCGSVRDGLMAAEAGADYIGTTLAGYTEDRARTNGPDIELVSELVGACDRPVIAEGRFFDPSQVVAALDAGAFAVCVGSAITHPGRTARRYLETIANSRA